MAGIPELHDSPRGQDAARYLRSLIQRWRAHHIAAKAEALALRLGPHLARDIGVGSPLQRAFPICLNPVR